MGWVLGWRGGGGWRGWVGMSRRKVGMWVEMDHMGGGCREGESWIGN